MTPHIAVADCETDPFCDGQTVTPFCWGFYDGSTYLKFWDDWNKGISATAAFLAHLEQLEEPHIIYAHNGGRFDWLFLLQKIRGNLKTIGNRWVKANLGIHELRDSFANIPVALKEFGDKLEINYGIMTAANRFKKKNMMVIDEYLKADCVELWLAIERYRAMFGDTLTMASAAMQQMNLTCTGEKGKKIYEQLSKKQDARMREYYYGGRVQAFQRGKLEGPWKMFDVVSMYPSVMQDCAHPISSGFYVQHQNGKITDNTDFAIIDATTTSFGCLPLRTKTALSFPLGRHTFFATGSEIRAGLSLGVLHLHDVRSTVTAHDRVCFKSFIQRFHQLRKQAKAAGDKVLALFYKLVLNSAYGKLAINPDKYEDMCCLPNTELPEGDTAYDQKILDAQCSNPTRADLEGNEQCACSACFGRAMAWRRHLIMDDITMWSRPIRNAERSLANVAAGASITGCARSKLAHGIHAAITPIYCDTDAIICRDMQWNDAVVEGNDLGQWQHETECHTAFIAGKKLYALLGDTPTDHTVSAQLEKAYGRPDCVKLASKGVRISADEIIRIASGEEITYTQQAPVFKFDSTGLVQQKLVRKIRMTA
jgi:DNA polymerase elongation subunit (family B)